MCGDLCIDVKQKKKQCIKPRNQYIILLCIEIMHWFSPNMENTFTKLTQFSPHVNVA